MTARTRFYRLRKWDRRTQERYRAGIMDGTDLRLTGYECPQTFDDEYDISFYLRPFKRRYQWVTNGLVAHRRGKYDGWHIADREMDKAAQEDAVETAVCQLYADIDAWEQAA